VPHEGSWSGQSPASIMVLGAAHCPLSRVVVLLLEDIRLGCGEGFFFFYLFPLIFYKNTPEFKKETIVSSGL